MASSAARSGDNDVASELCLALRLTHQKSLVVVVGSDLVGGGDSMWLDTMVVGVWVVGAMC